MWSLATFLTCGVWYVLCFLSLYRSFSLYLCCNAFHSFIYSSSTLQLCIHLQFLILHILLFYYPSTAPVLLWPLLHYSAPLGVTEKRENLILCCSTLKKQKRLVPNLLICIKKQKKKKLTLYFKFTVPWTAGGYCCGRTSSMAVHWTLLSGLYVFVPFFLVLSPLSLFVFIGPLTNKRQLII